MIYNKDKSSFFCEQCNKWINVKSGDYIIIDDAVTCMELHFCGYYWDLFPCGYLYTYRQENYCRCVHEKCDCNGKSEDCNFPIGKVIFEQDWKENEK